ncbi:RYamide receptor-like [Glandiceps talaboti]
MDPFLNVTSWYLNCSIIPCTSYSGVDDTLAQYEIVLLITAYVITFILSMLGNWAVIIVSKKSSHLSTYLKVYLTNLAAADICMAIFCMPFHVPTAILNEWTFGDVMCPITKYVQQVSIMVSTGTLIAVSIDRYQAVMNPLHRRASASHKGLVVSIIWISSLVLCSGQLIRYRAIPYYIDFNVKRICESVLLVKEERVIYEQIYQLVNFAVLFAIPFFTLVAMYGRIGYKVCRHTTPGNQDLNRDEINMRIKRRILVMLVIAVLAFFICWLPIQIFYILVQYYPTEVLNPDNKPEMMRLFHLMTFLAMSHSFVNPVIYTFMMGRFRKELRNITSTCCTPRMGLLVRSSSTLRDVLSRIASSRTMTSSVTTTQLNKGMGREEIEEEGEGRV